jgi:hypothetical protein
VALAAVESGDDVPVDESTEELVAKSPLIGPGFLGSLFRVAGGVVFFGGAVVTGLLVLLCDAVMGLDAWGWIAIITAAFVGVFFTVISWAFLLLFARIADYIDNKAQFAVDWR